jgi:large subunit ribosomal protein L23
MKINLYDVIASPVITEKSAMQSEKLRQYAFQVHKDVNKKQIKSAVEKIFNVHVTKVNVMRYSGKWRRVRFQPGKTAEWKKAIVTIKEGEKIDITA